MTTQDLKDYLLEEHARDKKFTFIYFMLIGIIISTIIGVIIYYGPSFKVNGGSFSNAPIYFKFLLPLIFLSLLAYPIYILYAINKRPADIDDLIQKLKDGSKASNITPETQYKIIIPLYIITFRLVPIEFLNIALDGSVKIYKMPLNIGYIADAKAILSGANMQNLYKAWDELYIEDTQTETTVAIPLKSIDEFNRFLNTELANSIKDVEESRAISSKYFKIFGGFSIFCVVAFMGFNIYNSYQMSSGNQTSAPNTMKFVIPFIAFWVIFYGAYFLFYKPKNANPQTLASGFEFSFKTKIFEKMIQFINPDAQYILHGHIGISDFLDSGLFQQKNYVINGNDQIIGKHNGVAFQYSDLDVSYKPNFTSEKEGPESVFCGQFFVARFNKQFTTPVFLVPKLGFKANFNDNSISNYTNNLGNKVLLEDPEFTKMYDVYASDQVEARYILTPALMQRIKDLTIRTKGKYYISFNNNKIAVANNNKTNLFEADIFTSFTKNDNALLVGFYKDLCDQFTIIDDLKLNINIWRN